MALVRSALPAAAYCQSTDDHLPVVRKFVFGVWCIINAPTLYLSRMGRRELRRKGPVIFRIADVTSDVAEQGVDQHEVWSVAVEDRVDDGGRKWRPLFSV